jgi:DNA-directed RNA polymerase specialized sigma24 family protein
LGSFVSVGRQELGVASERVGVASDPADLVVDRAQHHERVEAFAQLKTRERRDLFLQALGYRYREIAAATGSTYTAVNRRITEGRARLRQLG